MQPLARIHPVERLVEQQDRRVVDERRGDLRPLPHALRVGPDRSIGGGLEVDRAHRPSGGGLGSGQPLELRGERGRTRGRSGTDRPPRAPERARSAVDGRVAPRRHAVDEDPAARRPEEAREHVKDRRLARAVRAEQPGDPGAESERDVVHRDDVAVPARHPLELDGCSVAGRCRGGASARDGTGPRSVGTRHAVIRANRRMVIATAAAIPPRTAAKYASRAG